jgi:hypothetical protein
METCDDCDSWEDFVVPKLVIPVEPPVKKVSFPLAKEKPLPKILTETEIFEKEQREKELEIAFENAQKAFIDYQIKTVYTKYNHMNAMGKKKTMAKIMNEIKDCKNGQAILTRLEIQRCVDKGLLLSVDIA